MNIVIITGSHREKSNSEILAENFQKGAESSGHNVFLFKGARKTVHPCIGCDKCHMDGPCIYNDDMNEVREKLIPADFVVLASPMYYFGLSAQIKKIIDRFYAFNGHVTGNKKSCLMVTFGGDDLRTADGIVRQYEIMCDFLKWRDTGHLLVPNVNGAGDVLATEFPQKALEMGKSI